MFAVRPVIARAKREALAVRDRCQAPNSSVRLATNKNLVRILSLAPISLATFLCLDPRRDLLGRETPVLALLSPPQAQQLHRDC